MGASFEPWVVNNLSTTPLLVSGAFVPAVQPRPRWSTRPALAKAAPGGVAVGPGSVAVASTESRMPDETLTPPLDERRAEEAALLLRILEKDERAIEALCERYSGPLYSVAYQVTGADRFAQNVVQDVFVAEWKDAGRFDPSRGSLVGSP